MEGKEGHESLNPNEFEFSNMDSRTKPILKTSEKSNQQVKMYNIPFTSLLIVIVNPI